MSKRQAPSKPSMDELHALSERQQSSMLWQIMGWMGDDPNFIRGLRSAYDNVTDTSRAPLTVRCSECPYVEIAYNETVAEYRQQQHVHPCSIEINANYVPPER